MNLSPTDLALLEMMEKSLQARYPVKVHKQAEPLYYDKQIVHDKPKTAERKAHKRA